LETACAATIFGKISCSVTSRPKTGLRRTIHCASCGGVVNGILEAMSAEFAPLYSDVGRPSIPPEQLMRALLLQILYTVRSERQLMEQMQYNLLFRWFVGLTMDEGVWDASTFSANRDRLLNQAIAREFFASRVGAGAVARTFVRRTLQCGRHPDSGVGFAQELQAQGGQR